MEREKSGWREIRIAANRGNPSEIKAEVRAQKLIPGLIKVIKTREEGGERQGIKGEERDEGGEVNEGGFESWAENVGQEKCKAHLSCFD